MQQLQEKKLAQQTRNKLESETSASQPDADSFAGTGIIDGLDIAKDWLGASLEQLKVSLKLPLAEARLAATSFLQMTFLAVVAAVFALTAWGVSLAGLVLGLNSIGVPVWISLAGLGLSHGLIVLMILARIRTLSHYLELPETQRQMLGGTEDA